MELDAQRWGREGWEEMMGLEPQGVGNPVSLGQCLYMLVPLCDCAQVCLGMWSLYVVLGVRGPVCASVPGSLAVGVCV